MATTIPPATLLARAIHEKPPHGKLVTFDSPMRCALSGEEITEGYWVMDTVSKSYSRFMDTFRDADGYVSVDAATGIANDWNLGCRMIFEDGTHLHPLISKEQAEKQGRPCFSEAVRDVWPTKEGQSCLILITPDVKKRLWPMARTGTLGLQTPVTMLAGDYNVEECRFISWPALLATLDAIEAIYSAGFGKDAILNNLFRSRKAVETMGMTWTAEHEKSITELRTQPEFIPALLIAQATKEAPPIHRTTHEGELQL